MHCRVKYVFTGHGYGCRFLFLNKIKMRINRCYIRHKIYYFREDFEHNIKDLKAKCKEQFITISKPQTSEIEPQAQLTPIATLRA